MRRLIFTLGVTCALLGAGASIPAGAIPGVTPGYRLLGGDGGVFAFGSAHYLGSAATEPGRCATNSPDRFLPNGSCVALASTPDDAGYWILNRAGGYVYPFGDARSFGQPADQYVGVSPEFVPSFVAISPTSNGRGYWVLAVGASGAGTVMRFGDAGFFGDTQAIATRDRSGFNGSPVALAPTPDGGGYWEVHSDGGVFAFGNAHFFGSMAGAHLNKPIVGVAPTSDGNGYWLVAADGGVFAFGDAHFGGSVAGRGLSAAVIGIATNSAGPGYWLASADGGVFPLGGAASLGSLTGDHLAEPVLAIAANRVVNS